MQPQAGRIKKVVIFLLLVFANRVLGQTPEPTFFEVLKPFKHILADIQQDYVVAYDIRAYLEKCGVGPSISKVDTLLLQRDNSFKGKEFRIENINGQFYISSLLARKSKKYKLKKVENIKTATCELNHGYYLDKYFEVSDRFLEKYGITFYYCNGFDNWKVLTNTEINPKDFRIFADKETQEIEDSVSKSQEKFVTLTNYLVDNVNGLSYSDFRDSIRKLPALPYCGYDGIYYRKIVIKISRSKPDYVVSLYRDFPPNRDLIEFIVRDDEILTKKLKAVQKMENDISKKK